MDLALQKKHQAMLDRLSNRHQNRPKTPSGAATDSTATFLMKFSESKRSMESQLADASQLATSDTSNLKSHLADGFSSISSLEQLVAENSYILPSYELRASLKSICDLKQSLENLNSELLPKKKFSFKNKSKSTSTTATGSKETSLQGPEKLTTTRAIHDSPGIRHKVNEALTQNLRLLDTGEFTISDLDSCEVMLIGYVNALFINKLRNSKVYAGLAKGSILIEEVENCVFVLASHQIRIHYARGSDFYLRVRSRPLVEDCGGVRFAPYVLRYEGIEDDLREAGLDEESGNWCTVDDFSSG